MFSHDGHCHAGVSLGQPGHGRGADLIGRAIDGHGFDGCVNGDGQPGAGGSTAEGQLPLQPAGRLAGQVHVGGMLIQKVAGGGGDKLLRHQVPDLQGDQPQDGCGYRGPEQTPEGGKGRVVGKPDLVLVDQLLELLLQARIRGGHATGLQGR